MRAVKKGKVEAWWPIVRWCPPPGATAQSWSKRPSVEEPIVIQDGECFSIALPSIDKSLLDQWIGAVRLGIRCLMNIGPVSYLAQLADLIKVSLQRRLNQLVVRENTASDGCVELFASIQGAQ